MEKGKKLLKNKKVWVFLLLIILAVAIGFIVVVRKQKQKEEQGAEKVYQVKVMEAGETGRDVSLSYTGIVRKKPSNVPLKRLGRLRP